MDSVGFLLLVGDGVAFEAVFEEGTAVAAAAAVLL